MLKSSKFCSLLSHYEGTLLDGRQLFEVIMPLALMRVMSVICDHYSLINLALPSPRQYSTLIFQSNPSQRIRFT